MQADGRLDHRGLSGRFVPAAPVPAAGTLAGNDAIALLTDVTDTFDPTLAPGALSTIDGSLLLALGDLGRSTLLLRPHGFREEAECERRLAGLLAYPPCAWVLGVMSFTLGNQRLATMIARARAAGTAVVAYGDEAALAGCDRVVSDHDAGCRMLCEQLFARGCQHIVRIWNPGSGRAWLDQRDRGYERAHAAAGRPLLPHALPLPGSDEKQPMEVRARLFAACLLGHLGDGEEPVGVLAITDSDVFPLLAAGRLLNRELIVCGYDAYWQDRPEYRAHGDRPVATVDKQNRLLGIRLAELVAERIAGRLPPEPQLVVMAPLLKISG